MFCFTQKTSTCDLCSSPARTISISTAIGDWRESWLTLRDDLKLGVLTFVWFQIPGQWGCDLSDTACCYRNNYEVINPQRQSLRGLLPLTMVKFCIYHGLEDGYSYSNVTSRKILQMLFIIYIFRTKIDYCRDGSN